MGPTQQKHVGITGASGLIGRALCIALAEKQIPVVAWTREPDKFLAQLPTHLQSRITCLPYTLDAELQLPKSIELSAVVHAACELTHPLLSERKRINLSGTQKLFQSDAASRVGRWIFLSSMSAHDGALSAYGQSKREIEKLFLAQANAIVVRPGLVLAPSGVFARILESLRRIPVAPIFWGGTQPIQTIPLESLVAALITLLTTVDLPERWAREWNLAHEASLTLRDLYQTIARAIKRRLWLVPIPGELALRSLRALESIGALLGLRLSIGSEQLLGLKAMRHWETATSLQKLQLSVPSLEEWLKKRG